MKKLLYSLIVVLMVSCSNNMLYDESAVIPDASWDNEYVPFFNVNVDDTLTTYAFALNIRHMDDYDYSNLYVFMHVEYPNDSTQTYIINCPLAHPDGQWMEIGRASCRERVSPRV